MIGRLGALVFGSCAGFGWAAQAEPIHLHGLIFSDELGGVELHDGWGAGSLEDPFVLVEEITGHGPATLVVRGMSHRFGNRIRSHHDIGFALTKLVRNGTGQAWSLFNLELREFLDRASPFGDGLSFGQATGAGRPFRSDGFAESIETREPFDGVQFFNGLIGPGETVTVSFVVTDTTPRWEFFLLQKRDSPIAEWSERLLAEGATASLGARAWSSPDGPALAFLPDLEPDREPESGTWRKDGIRDR